MIAEIHLTPPKSPIKQTVIHVLYLIVALWEFMNPSLGVHS